MFPTWERGGIIPTAHEFAVAEPGAYSLEILVDGDNKQSVPFYIQHGPPPS